METKMYQINQLFARENNLPIFFVANQLIETAKAVYLYGHGTLESQKLGQCCRCGRELTHPVSITLGIGPECGGHYWDWNAVGGIEKAPEIIEQLRITIQNFKIDQWMPKGIIKEVHECETVVVTPTNHPMLKPLPGAKKNKTATQVKYQGTEQKAIKIEFPFDREVLEQVKTLQGRRFHGETSEKYWSCPLGIEAVEKLNDWGFVLCAKLQEYLQKTKTSIEDMQQDLPIPGLKMELFPFQKKGVAFIDAKNGRALVGDEMGLGKTAQALAWLQLRQEKRPVIIIVPASLKLNWAKEAKMWMDSPNTQILSGTKPNVPIIGELIIINYDVVTHWLEVLQKVNAQVLILDEAHYCKNNSAQRTKAVKRLAKNIPHIIALTGTPIVNRPVELFNAIKLIDDTVVPSFWHYARRYCGARHNGFGWDFTGATNTDELHKKLTETIMLRRLKKDVLTELPDKIYSFTPMELSNEKEYNKAERDFITWIKETKGNEAAAKASGAAALVEIEGLKQLAVAGKMAHSIEWIKNFLDGNGKLVVMATHRSAVDQLMEEFKNIAVKVDGSVNGEDRQKAVDQFQNNDNVRLFVGNIKAAGVGLTLTAASNVAFLELPWTPGDLQQAEDRCHRIGQKNSVIVHYLLATGTIEEKIARMLDSKRRVLDSVLDGAETAETSLLSELIREYAA